MAQTPCNFVSPGNTVTITPVGALAAGEVVLLGSTVVAISIDAYTAEDLAAGKAHAVSVRGEWSVPKDGSDVNEGDALYWDASGNPVGGTAGTGAFTKTADGNVFAGVATADAGVSATSVNMLLRSIDGTVPGNLAPVPVASVEAANSAQNNGAAITSLGLTKVLNADNTKAVVLPDVDGSPIGSVLFLNNFAGDNKTLAVFPEVGAQINALGANNAYTQATNTTIGFVRYNNTQWYTF